MPPSGLMSPCLYAFFDLPTVLFVKDMGVVARVEGMLMADELQQLADQHFFGGAKPAAEGAA